MRHPLWETSAGALHDLLASRAPLNRADLYTLTLSGGAVLRWSGSDVAITGNGNTWALGPGITRGRVKWAIGVQVDTLDLTLTDASPGTLINGVALLPFIAGGGLIGARLQLDRCFWGVNDTAPVGAYWWFGGRVAEMPKFSRYEAQLTVRSDLELLDVMVPREVTQAGCLNVHFDSACGLARASWATTGTAGSATDSRRISFTWSHSPAGYFDLGILTMTSGANAGISRTVRTQSTTVLTVLNPWPQAVAPGDTFSITPGCDKAQATCSGKFSNLARFRGLPYIPVPETAL